MKRINQPLQSMAAAADAVGRGESTQLLPEEGAEEFARVTHAFNRMQEALARTETDRNLLLGGISHDLRTPLSRLRLAVEMLPTGSGQRSGMVQDIADMDAIIAQFLDFIRGAEGEQASMGSLNDVVRDTASRYRREGRNVQLDLGVLPPIPLRSLAMRRLLTNLIDNAYDYGGGRVQVTTQLKDGMLTLSVRDFGPGLLQSETERLLRPFERLDIARGREGGAGLGLAIAARVARIHQGDLKLQNHPEGGLIASVVIPVGNRA
jgi:two-component system osmolarity sensor histidine kinase EnvZ